MVTCLRKDPHLPHTWGGTFIVDRAFMVWQNKRKMEGTYQQRTAHCEHTAATRQAKRSPLHRMQMGK